MTPATSGWRTPPIDASCVSTMPSGWRMARRRAGSSGRAPSSRIHPAAGQGAFADPVAVTVDGTGTLWVADRSNNRVSGFPLAGSAANGAAATRVLGQSSFATVTAGLSASRFDGPSGVFADANVLWVLDQSNHRALRFAGLGGIANGGAASTVVGQPDFTSKDTTVNARRLESPFVGLFSGSVREPLGLRLESQPRPPLQPRNRGTSHRDGPGQDPFLNRTRKCPPPRESVRRRFNRPGHRAESDGAFFRPWYREVESAYPARRRKKPLARLRD
jgi:hypothetical protein